MEEIKSLFESKEIKKEKINTYLNLVDLNEKYSKLLRINWDLIDFKDYFNNPDKLLKAITIIYENLKEF